MTRDRRRLGALCLAAMLALLAGCLGDAGPADAGAADAAARSDAGGSDPEPGPRIDLTDRPAAGHRLVAWNGSSPSGSAPPCSSPCQEVPFTLEPGDDGQVGDQLVVSATWDSYAGGHDRADPRGAVNVTVLDAAGSRLATGPAVWWSAAAVVDDPAPGRYTALIQASGGGTDYKGVVHVQDDPAAAGDGPGRDLLPDLVVEPVIHVQRTSPLLVRGTPADSGCDPHERLEHGAENCLRFTTSVGNVGEGPLEVRMSFGNATRAVARGLGAPVDARFTQAVHRADGSRREVPVGQGEFHPAHQHFHKEGFASFTLYEHDPETGERGEVVREGRKSSWCLVDMGLAAPEHGPYTTAARYPIDGARTEPQTRANCAAATPTRDMVTGVSPGWYDMYEWHQPDQYVEVTDLPDGTYELVTRADPEGQLLESDPGNNAAGVVFAWEDGEPTVLDRWSDGVDR